MSSSNLKPIQSDTAYWIRKDKEDYIKKLFTVHRFLIPKIKKDDGFAALSSIPILSIPWPLYVMALTRSLNPAAKPAFYDLPIDDVNCTIMSVTFSTSIDKSISGCRIICNICRLTFLPCARDIKGDLAIRDVSALYKLHKSTDRLDDYPLCSACFFALLNPEVELDYPKQNRKDPVNKDDYYINNFQMLKRESNFGYCGKIMIKNDMVRYVVPDHALMDSSDGDPPTLNNDFAG